MDCGRPWPRGCRAWLHAPNPKSPSDRQSVKPGSLTTSARRRSPTSRTRIQHGFRMSRAAGIQHGAPSGESPPPSASRSRRSHDWPRRSKPRAHLPPAQSSREDPGRRKRRVGSLRGCPDFCLLPRRSAAHLRYVQPASGDDDPPRRGRVAQNSRQVTRQSAINSSTYANSTSPSRFSKASSRGLLLAPAF